MLPERRWALLRLILGFAQVFGASLGATLVLRTGVTEAALVAVTWVAAQLPEFEVRANDAEASA